MNRDTSVRSSQRLSKIQYLHISLSHALISHNRSQWTRYQFEKQRSVDGEGGEETKDGGTGEVKDWQLVVLLRITRLFIITGHEKSTPAGRTALFRQ